MRDIDLSSSDLPAIRNQYIDSATSLVVKVGTRVLTTPEGKLDLDRIDLLAEGLCDIADTGRQVIMVSSGAVGAGMGKLNLETRPSGLAQLQAVAAIGQTDLIQAYEKSLAKRGRHAAQVLLTTAELRRRKTYLNVRNAFARIHEYGAIAIVNENDCVAVSELKTTFGDNDRLAAQVAGLLGDTVLVILSDIDGLFDGPPESDTSEVVEVVEEVDDSVRAMAQVNRQSSSKGGMASKLEAAAIAASHGHPTVIAPGRDDRVLQKILAGEEIGTLFLADQDGSVRGRRRWIGASAEVDGAVTIDDGASRAVKHCGSSLLAIGITKVRGPFKRGSVVSLRDRDGNEVARGLCNYSSGDVEKIRGKASDEISEILGHCPYESVVHRDNLVLTVL
ncbi:Glutamate 5-kinase [Rubripirellula obstinata]|uniref:Glutamate 5-kinase n=1 Tax=Rubripirellula obstinata TaxID=406547 RepID=A0A5B1CRD2_9BACT|nr:glutamate 5-kinase [Rubripirellula obstinata]KAA1261804.1 Glutamate 5-kinase [Rubripirellula obstinata]